MSYPEQYDEFAKVTYEMLHLHKVKAKAYGANAIGATGFYGIVVRMSDKVQRLLTLSTKTAPLSETIEDTLLDLALMRYLVRMVTPPGGVVLDPFMGSGSTGCAAVREGFDFVGIDLTPEYVAIAQKRIDWHAVTSPLDNVATMELHEENDA